MRATKLVTISLSPDLLNEMPKVVLDTNVLVSALHFGRRPREVLDLARHGHIELVISPLHLTGNRKGLKGKIPLGGTNSPAHPVQT